jgi:DtxR family Mn-dependent transcriptional regulator
MKDSIHFSKENYLKAILEAEAEGHEVIPAPIGLRFQRQR